MGGRTSYHTSGSRMPFGQRWAWALCKVSLWEAGAETPSIRQLRGKQAERAQVDLPLWILVVSSDRTGCCRYFRPAVGSACSKSNSSVWFVSKARQGPTSRLCVCERLARRHKGRLQGRGQRQRRRRRQGAGRALSPSSLTLFRLLPTRQLSQQGSETTAKRRTGSTLHLLLLLSSSDGRPVC